MKIGQETSNSFIINENESKEELCQYVKVDCSYPLKLCPFYLLYKIT